MKPKRILHIIRPAEGGMKGHLLALAEGLRIKGYDIEMACPAHSPLAAELRDKGFRLHPVDLVGPLNPVKDAICIGQLRRVMRRNPFDIIHMHGAKAGLVGRIAAVLAGCRNTVLTVHNFIIYDEVPWFKKALFKFGEKILSRVTARVITVSEALKKELVSKYNIQPEMIITVYNGINLSHYLTLPDKDRSREAYGIKPGAMVVGTVARMAPQKGLQYLLEAVPLICGPGERNSPDIVIVIAGDGPLRPQLEDQAERLGIRDQVIFTGFVRDTAGFFASLDIFIIPSVSEGLSITTIEAMAAGLPVIASRVGGLPELVLEGASGYLVDPRNPQALAAAILRLASNRDAMLLFGSRGRDLAFRNFGTEKMVEETCRVYEGLCHL